MWAYRIILPVFVGFPTSLHIVYQNLPIRNPKIDSLKSIYVACYVLHVSHFLVNTIYHNIVNPIYYHFPNYSYYTNCYNIQDTTIFTTIISILQYCYRYAIHCNYIVTIIISITYRYIYRYNLSIKRDNSQYRYNYIYSIIGIILNNTEMYIYGHASA